VVGFVLKFLAGYGNTLINSTVTSSSSSHAAASTEADAADSMLASFGTEPKRDKALGMHRMVSSCQAYRWHPPSSLLMEHLARLCWPCTPLLH
jgi:hypothetical protein